MIRHPPSTVTISSMELNAKPASSHRSNDTQLFEPLRYPPLPTPIRNNIWHSRPVSAGQIYSSANSNICSPLYSGSAPLTSTHLSREASPRVRSSIRHHRLIRAFMAFAERLSASRR